MNDVRLAVELEEWLNLALGDLTEKQRFVVERSFGLFGHEEHSTREIAAMMGISKTAVANILQRALESMRGVAKTAIIEELFSPVQPVGEDEDDAEEICSSPFIPARYGLTPRGGYAILSEWDETDERTGWPPDGFQVGRLEEL